MLTERLKSTARRFAERRRERQNMKMLRRIEPWLLKDTGLDHYIAAGQDRWIR